MQHKPQKNKNMRKKILLIVISAIISIATFAQKPVGTNPFSIEGGLTVNAMTGQTFSAPDLRLRYFINDAISVRLGVMFNSDKTTDYIYGLNDDGFPVESKQGSFEQKDFSTQFSLGGAYHFAQKEKLSPYAGLDITFLSGSYNETWKNSDQNLTAFDENTSGHFKYKYSGFGFMIFTGADYYFAENIYIGLEIGIGMSNAKDKSGEWSQTVGQTTTTITTFQTFADSYFGNMFSQMIRLGWRF